MPVAGNSWTEIQHRGTDHGCTRTGLNTRLIEARVYHTTQDPRCKLCKDAPETVQHIIVGCKMLAAKAYMKRCIIHRNICAEYQLEVPRSTWEILPKVIENERVVDNQRTSVVVNVTIPSNGNIRKMEHEKLEKPQRLKLEELEKMWSVKAVVVPIVIGTLGAITSKMDWWLQQTSRYQERNI